MTSYCDSPRSYADYLSQKYRPELDGLRAISVLLLISVHMHAESFWRWMGGPQRVSIFFVLSGYLITSLSLAQERKRGQISLAAFYIRRAFRIFPLYYIALALYCLLIFGLRIEYETKGFLLGKAMPWYLFYMQEVPSLCGVADQNGLVRPGFIPFRQSWSLGIEEKFYLVWPVLLFVLWRGKSALRLTGTATLVVAFALVPTSFALVAPLAEGWNLADAALCIEPYYRIFLGCLLALALNDRVWFERLRGLGSKTGIGISLAAWVTLHFLWPLKPTEGTQFDPIADARGAIYTLAVSAFLVSVLLGDGPIHGFLRRPSLMFIGKISYGIYLLHILCINVAERLMARIGEGAAVNVLSYALACALSIAVAYITYQVIEQPLIGMGRQLSNRLIERAETASLPAVAADGGARTADSLANDVGPSGLRGTWS